MNELTQEMKDRLDDDYHAITSVIDALKSEIDVCDDAMHKGLALSACHLFFSAKRLVDIACTDTYSGIASDLKYAHGFVNGASLSFSISPVLLNALNDAQKFDGAWCVDPDERNEYMHRLADMLHGYVIDDDSYFRELFYDCIEQ